MTLKTTAKVNKLDAGTPSCTQPPKPLHTVLYRHIYAVKAIILSHFSRPKVTLKTIAKVNKLDAGTP